MNDQWWWMVMMMMNDVKDAERWWKMMNDYECCVFCVFSQGFSGDPYFWRWRQRHTDWSTMQIEASIILVKPQSGSQSVPQMRSIFNCHLEHLPPSGGVLDSRVFFLGRLRPGGGWGAAGPEHPWINKDRYNYEWNGNYKTYKVHAMITFLVECQKKTNE